MRKKPEPIHYQIRRAIMADPALSSTPKLVADALLLTFRNNTTGLCNPSLNTIALAVGRCKRTVIEAIKELKAGNDPWLIVRSTGGGSKNNTNNYEFRLKGTGAIHCTGEEDCTGEENVGTGEADCTEGVKQTAHELSIELSRTNKRDFKERNSTNILVEADGREGDRWRSYWRANGIAEPFRVRRGRYYVVPTKEPP
jgi:hypothetical protein